MKLFRFLPALTWSVIVLFLMSCGNSGDKTDTTTTDTTAATTSTTEATTPASTIVTTPTTMMVVTHKVKDFDKWLPVFEGHDTALQASGLHRYVVGRSVADPNVLIVVTKADDLNKAKAFAKDKSLKEAMERSGVTGTPKIQFTEVVWQETAPVSSDVRVITSVTVKDWDAWKRSFDSTRQLNTDNGLALRAYGHDADDNKQVAIVSAIIDSAKAEAYWKSDLLKERRKVSGAGEPKRFVYRVAKRY